eukprot:CAMPEP_0206610352 /NCGR_PEP_ID=MMETSP0325_2-20121206/54490_1 /ASSEMBLY_ACC=CAM_ASM_000347 /TAXON_ID=2866 /ORGANISM="Crypthecodinium cohnii, Strain Seligo" /LENGTH=90 /DNA_ID=CAMNT_0054129131 /DNA_START=192 /DNA_END=460 /DNA_ORIENTATION=-
MISAQHVAHKLSLTLKPTKHLLDLARACASARAGKAPSAARAVPDWEGGEQAGIYRYTRRCTGEGGDARTPVKARLLDDLPPAEKRELSV